MAYINSDENPSMVLLLFYMSRVLFVTCRSLAFINANLEPGSVQPYQIVTSGDSKPGNAMPLGTNAGMYPMYTVTYFAEPGVKHDVPPNMNTMFKEESLKGSANADDWVFTKPMIEGQLVENEKQRKKNCQKTDDSDDEGICADGYQETNIQVTEVTQTNAPSSDNNSSKTNDDPDKTTKNGNNDDGYDSSNDQN
ncbi:hypothetical protein ENBRE01_0695 [Enteropsectra breve]|nr:hypothetical protein ENBRE01_0695 [Enteropsectra breve]